MEFTLLNSHDNNLDLNYSSILMLTLWATVPTVVIIYDNYDCSKCVCKWICADNFALVIDVVAVVEKN
uniref:Uncharacterized protein n=1 Tax=Glossina palpalis gambiensis TaxID=67801 RepID=A0A1B0C3D6_9MUSC